MLTGLFTHVKIFFLKYNIYKKLFLWQRANTNVFAI